MPVRRTKPDKPIARLGGRDRIEVSPSAKILSADELNALLEGKTEEEALEVFRARRSPEENAAFDEIVAGLNRVAIGPAWLAEQKRIAEEILNKSADLIDPEDFVREREPGSITYGITAYPVGSAPWYASEIQGHIGYLRRLLRGQRPDGIIDSVPADNDDMWLILDAAMRLASVWTEAKIAGAFTKPLETGLKQTERLAAIQKAANAQRHMKAKLDHRRWKAEAEGVWSRKHRLSAWACANAVIKSLGLSVVTKTVADIIRPLKPKVRNAR